ncbi:MAG: GNAT family N-acetyltransferase [Lachnospiraceae bacterium]|nr:GNAT family N-acetyltransferase [Lachnospiraceae bacterium]
MNNTHEVKITENSEEAAYFAANQIPYIVWLNESNKGQSFPCGAYCVENMSDIDAEYLERVYRRFKGIPWDIAETQRLRIREITVDDVARLYELYRSRDITRYMEPLFEDPQQETAYTKEYIKNVYGFYGYGMWVIEEKKSGQVIGRAGLEYKEGFEGLELGFMLGADYQHKGYAYEACRAVLDYGVQVLEQSVYYAVVHEKNTPSRRLCERLEFVLSERIQECWLRYCFAAVHPPVVF